MSAVFPPPGRSLPSLHRWKNPYDPSSSSEEGQEDVRVDLHAARCASPRDTSQSWRLRTSLAFRCEDSLAEAVVHERDSNSLHLHRAVSKAQGLSAPEKLIRAVLPGICHLALNPFLLVELGRHPASEIVFLPLVILLVVYNVVGGRAADCGCACGVFNHV